MVFNYSSFVVTCPMKQELHVGSLIMGRNNKLLPNHKGPCQVIGREQSIYIIEDLVKGKQIKTQVNPLDVAQQNEQEFIVERILAHLIDRIVHHIWVVFYDFMLISLKLMLFSQYQKCMLS